MSNNNNTTIKLVESELAEMRLLQEKFQQKVFQLGQLYLQKLQAEANAKIVADQEVKLRDEWVSIQKMENDFLDKLAKKYGDGSLDPLTGNFISEKKTTP